MIPHLICEFKCNMKLEKGCVVKIRTTGTNYTIEDISFLDRHNISLMLRGRNRNLLYVTRRLLELKCCDCPTHNKI